MSGRQNHFPSVGVADKSRSGGTFSSSLGDSSAVDDEDPNIFPNSPHERSESDHRMDVDEPAGPVNDEEGSQSDEPRDTGAIDELEALMNKKYGNDDESAFSFGDDLGFLSAPALKPKSVGKKGGQTKKRVMSLNVTDDEILVTTPALGSTRASRSKMANESKPKSKNKGKEMVIDSHSVSHSSSGIDSKVSEELGEEEPMNDEELRALQEELEYEKRKAKELLLESEKATEEYLRHTNTKLFEGQDEIIAQILGVSHEGPEDMLALFVHTPTSIPYKGIQYGPLDPESMIYALENSKIFVEQFIHGPRGDVLSKAALLKNLINLVLNFEDSGAPLLIGKALVVINDIVNTTSTGFPDEVNFEWIQRRLEEFGADFSSNEAPSRETLAECESRLRGLSKAWETRRYNLRGFLNLIPIILSKRGDEFLNQHLLGLAAILFKCLVDPVASSCMAEAQNALAATLDCLSPRLSREAFPQMLIDTLTEMVGELNMKHRMLLEWVRRFPARTESNRQLRHQLAFKFACRLLHLDEPFPTKQLDQMKSLLHIVKSIQLFDVMRRRRRQEKHWPMETMTTKVSSAPPTRKKRKQRDNEDDDNDIDNNNAFPRESKEDEDGASMAVDIDPEEREQLQPDNYEQRVKREMELAEEDKTDYSELYSVVQLVALCFAFEATRLHEKPQYEVVSALAQQFGTLFTGIREGTAMLYPTKTHFKDAVQEQQTTLQMFIAAFAPKGPSDQVSLTSLGFSVVK